VSALPLSLLLLLLPPLMLLVHACGYDERRVPKIDGTEAIMRIGVRRVMRKKREGQLSV
jgi:hypothetical protein